MEVNGIYTNSVGETFAVQLKQSKSKTVILVFGEYTQEDIVRRLDGEPMQDGRLSGEVLNSSMNVRWLRTSVHIKKVSKAVEAWGNYQLANEVLELIDFGKSYSFKADEILSRVDRNTIDGVVYSEFSASNQEVVFNYKTADDAYTSLSLRTPKELLVLDNRFKIKSLPTLEHTKVSVEDTKTFRMASIKDVSMEGLRELLDLGWYEEHGVPKKDYGCITNKEEFDQMVDELIDAYLKSTSSGDVLKVGLDTETTGLNCYDLDENNPYKSDLVAIPISWEEDQARVVFIDMEYFDNVDKKYALKRLGWLLERQHPKTVTVMHSVKGPINVDQTLVNVTGHNVLFDNRVFYSCGVDSYFDDDTLQLAFNLNPSEIKKDGGNKLKALTRKIYGHETPELSDILGKGNEDAYRLLRDKRVAEIYGCADADYSRKLREYLVKLTPPTMYKNYKSLDVPLLNHLHKAEYFGMKTDRALVESMAKRLESDLSTIREFTYKYVGMMISYREKRTALETKRKIGILDEEAFQKEVMGIRVDPNAYFVFEFKGSDLRRVLYDLLKYPILGYTKSETKPMPSVDKNTMNRLLREVLEESSGALKEDIVSAVSGKVLISKDVFNSYRYPLAYVLLVYSDLNKDLVSYCNPVLKDSMDGKLFKNFSMARIATRRISNPGQTMKSAYKSIIVPISEDYYLCDFDMSQVEYRIMLSLSGNKQMIELMKNPEKDYHTETAAFVFDKPAHEVSKDLRKKTKTIGFGIPYGLGDRKFCENIFGKVTQENLYETRKLLETFKNKNKMIMDLLEGFRDKALEPVKSIDADTRKLIGFTEEQDIGMVRNLKGFYRLFDLTNLDNKRTAGIRREAGNFPIQSLAAELFRTIIIRFKEACEREGIQDKVVWHMLVHDELLCSVHKSINPVLLTKLIKEACMFTVSGHTKYFVGINYGYSWKETKADLSELPVYLAEELADRWDKGELREYNHDDPVSTIRELRIDYIKRRIGEVVQQLQPNLDEPLDVVGIFSRFTNYTVRSYISDFYPPFKEDKNIEQQYLRFISWAKEFFTEDKEVRWVDGRVYRIKDLYDEHVESVDLELNLEEDDADLELILDQDNWSFNEDTFTVSYDEPTEIEEEIVEDAFSFNHEKSYPHVGVIVNTVTFSVSTVSNQIKLLRVLEQYKTSSGLLAFIRVGKQLIRIFDIKDDTPLEKISDLISKMEEPVLKSTVF